VRPSGTEGVTRSESPTGKSLEAVRVWLLGGFSVAVGERRVRDGAWHLRKAASLIKLLVLAPGHRLHREQAMELLWPDLDKKAASNNLRQALHAARRALASDPSGGSEYLASEDESLVLCPEGWLWVDLESFLEVASTARRSRESAAYRTALELYAGELLPDDRYEEWAQSMRERLRREYVELLIELAGLYEERGHYGQAVDALHRALSEDPANEEAHADLMRLYALSGRPGEALTQYERLRDVLSGRLGTAPGEVTRALREEIATGRFTPNRPAAPPPEEAPHAAKHNLPAPRTSFVGREREMVELKRMLAMTGLLTLTGTGGCGKTRLALEIAGDLIGIYPDGVWLVELAPLSEETLLPQALAAMLGVREQPGRPLLDTLLDALRDKETLVVLDNCDNLLGGARRLTQALLDFCPRLRVLATSREPLGVTSELVRLVPSLSAPDGQLSPTIEELEVYESARLFADRASSRHPGFELTPENAQAVARVCARLEGIPLAIELAAARVGVLSAEQISARLGHSLRLLTGGARTADHRHKTLRAALDWSYELLGEPEQVLFRRLSVFAGGFTLEAAESVVAGGGIEKDDVLDLLSGLVEKSLLVAEESWQSGARYRLLDPVRQYAREKLEEGGEANEVQRRHAEWCLRFAKEAEKESAGRAHVRWLPRLETEHDNLRAALGWSLGEKGDTELGLRLAGTLWVFWFTQGYSSEGWRWLERGISLGGSKAARAKALNGAGWIALFQGDSETAKGFLEESVTLYRELEDEEGLASSLNYLGYVALLGGREDIPVAALLEEALALKPRIQNLHSIADTLVFAALDALLLRSEWEETVALHEEALTLYREMDDRWGLSYCLTNLGLISAAMGRHARAKELLRELMHRSRKLGDMFGSQYSFFGLACVADSEGHTARAARLWGVSEAIREAGGFRLPHAALSVMEYESRLVGARARMGAATLEEAWVEGKAMTTEEAIEYALSEEEADAPTTPMPEESRAGEPMGELTLREQEVALLVARGLTNRQISTRLGISERTVGNHVAKILRKLGLRSRTQIATWATERHLLTPHPD
jgi:predicted ATPase/DNA-binding SARP family transcriptional activator/DNA-binding CsgD family transcriptional regulator